jgi:hypothetical protein
LNCKFYDPSAHWQCRENIPEEVREKDKANFCEYFQLRPTDQAAPHAPGQTEDKAKEARDKLDKLFGDG